MNRAQPLRHSSFSWNLISFFLLLSACVPAPPPLTPQELQAFPDAAGLPADVQRFMIRHQACEHWLGEPDWDEARRRQIAQAVRDSCRGIDSLGRRIRQHHAGNADVLWRLREYAPLGR